MVLGYSWSTFLPREVCMLRTKYAVFIFYCYIYTVYVQVESVTKNLHDVLPCSFGNKQGIGFRLVFTNLNKFVLMVQPMLGVQWYAKLSSFRGNLTDSNEFTIEVVIKVSSNF